MSVRYLVLAAASLALASSSAIPMWEFLTRGEKMSHLFNMFVMQVADHCASSNMPDCEKVLLVYGLTNLAKMEDSSLDKMDPYQRGANDIIWESMMHGSYKKKTEDHKDYYADALEPSTSDGNHLGSQEEASSKVESYSGNGYIVGPMVVRVRPDGSPVPEDAGPLPRDEDKEEYQVMRGRPVPSLDQLEHHHQHNQQQRRYSSIADILGSAVEASTYKPKYTGIEDLLAAGRKQNKASEDISLTTPPGYVHHKSLSQIEEEWQKQQNQENSRPSEVVSRQVSISSSVSSSRKARHN